ncbi:transcriptional regulator [Methylocystis sp. MitZ-2018]|nr:transcriptional regulator [Methylocystis sp. MitZ-2018]
MAGTIRLSTFKIIWKSDYVKPPHQTRDASLAKTLGSPRHKALIDLLIQKREAAGLTQADLAERLGEYQSFVARLESGERRVDVVEFLQLADVLGFDAAQAIARLKKVS